MRRKMSLRPAVETPFFLLAERGPIVQVLGGASNIHQARLTALDLLSMDSRVIAVEIRDRATKLVVERIPQRED